MVLTLIAEIQEVLKNSNEVSKTAKYMSVNFGNPPIFFFFLMKKRKT